MGIRGLTSYIASNSAFVEDCRLHDCTLVVDGSNQVYALYENSGADFKYGGDYLKFATYVKNYLEKFKKCNIKLIVVFDGGSDKSGCKLTTQINRAKDRNACAQNISRSVTNVGQILFPVLAFNVFETCLKEMNIITVRSSFEADSEITSIAAALRCPVVSNDSDFYIYNLPYGFVRTDTISLDVRGNDKTCFYLQTKIYYLKKFLSSFPGLQISHMPLFASIAGNDRTNSELLAQFFSSTLPNDYLAHNLSFGQQQRNKIIKLLEWLKNYHVEDALARILRTLRDDSREEIRSQIKNSMDNYKKSSTYLLHYIDGTHPWEPSSLITSCNEKELPQWFCEKVHKELLSPFFINCICSCRIFLPTQIEDFQKESPYNCALKLRRKIYGIFFYYICPNSWKEDSKKILVEEYSREGTNLSKYSVSPLFDPKNLPRLEDFPKLSKHERRLYFRHFLDIDKKFVVSVPRKYAVFACSLLYALQHSSPKIEKGFVGSLLLCLVYFSIVLPLSKTGSRHPEISEPFTEEKQKNLPLEALLLYIRPKETCLAKSNLEKYATQPNIWRQVAIVPLHQFSQFQAILLTVLELNMLFDSPYPDPVVANSVNGPFIYNIYHDLISAGNIEDFISRVLGPKTWLGSFCTKFFHLLLDNAEA